MTREPNHAFTTDKLPARVELDIPQRITNASIRQPLSLKGLWTNPEVIRPGSTKAFSLPSVDHTGRTFPDRTVTDSAE